MKEVMAVVLRKIQKMSDEDFAKKLALYKKNELAVALRHIQDDCSGEQSSASSCSGDLRQEVDEIKSSIPIE